MAGPCRCKETFTSSLKSFLVVDTLNPKPYYKPLTLCRGLGSTLSVPGGLSVDGVVALLGELLLQR